MIILDVLMNLFLDCEFNGFGGELISMALVDEHGHYFYQVLPCPTPIDWVAQNVIPLLNQAPISLTEFQQKLSHFLHQYNNVHIIADWPEDLALFCNSLLVAPGKAIRTPNLSMQLWSIPATLNIVSTQAHNALADAQALAAAYQQAK